MRQIELKLEGVSKTYISPHQRWPFHNEPGWKSTAKGWRSDCIVRGGLL